jgi:hypothetical protein
LEARSKEWNSLENGYHSQLSEKDAEIRHLLLQVDLASQSNVEEVAHTRQLIQESMREMEAHKAKRLAARNEMITLAKVGSDADIGCRCNMCTVVPNPHRAWSGPRQTETRSRHSFSSSWALWWLSR